MLPAGNDSLQARMSWMELAADGSYGRIMRDFRHPEGRLAPALLRDFLVMAEPTRLRFEQGVACSDSGFIFWWELTDIGFPCSVDSLVLLTQHYMREKEYATVLLGSPTEWGVEFNTGSRVVLFHLREIERHERRSTARLCLSIRFPGSNALITVKEIMKAYPALLINGLPLSLTKLLDKVAFRQISYGGSWDRYYIWSLSVPAEAMADPAGFRLRIIKIIRDYGYVFRNQVEGSDVFRLVRTDNTSLRRLRSDEEGGLTLGFQAIA